MTQKRSRRSRNLRRKRIRSLNPIHPHCGPFNEISSSSSDDRVDDACRRHDIGYARIQDEHGYLTPYISNSDTDRMFIDDLKEEPGVLPRIYRGVFELKRLLPLPQIESSIATESFVKMPGKVKRSRKVGKKSLKRSRRKSKAIKRVTRLQILKAIGSRFMNTRAYNLNLRHTFSGSSNRSRLFAITGLGDWQDLNQMMNEDYGPYGYIGDSFWNNGRTTSKGVLPNYVVSNVAHVKFSNVCNADVRMRILKVNLTKDFLDTVYGFGAGETNVPTAGCFEFLKYLDSNLNPGLHTTSFEADLSVFAGGQYGDANASATFTNGPPVATWTRGSPLPLGKSGRNGFRYQYGPWFKLESGQAVNLRLKGKKGFIPTHKMGLRTNPVTPPLLGSEQTMQMTPFTVLYFTEVEKLSHVIVTTTTNSENVRESYADGSYRVVGDVVMKSVMLGQHNYIQGGRWAAVSDLRPNASTPAQEVGLVDADEDLEAIVE